MPPTVTDLDARAQDRVGREGPGRPDLGSLLAAVALLEGWSRVPSLKLSCLQQGVDSKMVLLDTEYSPWMQAGDLGLGKQWEMDRTWDLLWEAGVCNSHADQVSFGFPLSLWLLGNKKWTGFHLISISPGLGFHMEHFSERKETWVKNNLGKTADGVHPFSLIYYGSKGLL